VGGLESGCGCSCGSTGCNTTSIEDQIN
jgi:hypothetical protein